MVRRHGVRAECASAFAGPNRGVDPLFIDKASNDVCEFGREAGVGLSDHVAALLPPDRCVTLSDRCHSVKVAQFRNSEHLRFQRVPPLWNVVPSDDGVNQCLHTFVARFICHISARDPRWVVAQPIIDCFIEQQGVVDIGTCAETGLKRGRDRLCGLFSGGGLWCMKVCEGGHEADPSPERLRKFNLNRRCVFFEEPNPCTSTGERNL